ncbi:hypothetical protein GCM10027615_36470 [Plantactinospora veratri]
MVDRLTQSRPVPAQPASEPQGAPSRIQQHSGTGVLRGEPGTGAAQAALEVGVFALRLVRRLYHRLGATLSVGIIHRSDPQDRCETTYMIMCSQFAPTVRSNYKMARYRRSDNEPFDLLI